MSQTALTPDVKAAADPLPAAQTINVTTPSTPPAPTPPPTPASRPDFLPENYWNADAKAPKLDALWNDLQAKQTELARFESMAATAPQQADGYKVELPKD